MPFGFHVTGMPISAAAEKLTRELADKVFGVFYERRNLDRLTLQVNANLCCKWVSNPRNFLNSLIHTIGLSIFLHSVEMI